MTFSIPFTPDDERQLAQRAVALGLDPASLALGISRRELSRAMRVASLLAPAHDEFERSGMSEKDLTNLLEQAKHDLRRETRAKAS